MALDRRFRLRLTAVAFARNASLEYDASWKAEAQATIQRRPYSLRVAYHRNVAGELHSD